MKLVCAVMLMLGVSTNAFAQSSGVARSSDPPRRLVLPSADTLHLQSPTTSERRDSLKNGALIGAAIGAGTLGGFGLFICQVLKEPGDPSCWPGTLAIAGIGAGIGAAAGAGIDALIDRRPMVPRSSPPGHQLSFSLRHRF
jgi:hypothetical protein